MELLDVVDINDNVIDVLDRDIVHEKNLLHREVIIFIINSRNEVLIQQRSSNKKSDPNKWGLCAGHVDSGEDVFDSALRETYEEVGLELKKEDLIFIDKELVMKDNNSHFNYMYYCLCDWDVSKFTIQKEELNEVKWMGINELICRIRNHDSDFCLNEDKVDELRLLQMIRYNYIETDRLILRKARLDDLDDIYNNIWSREEIAKYMLWKTTKNLEDAKIRINKTINYQSRNFAYFIVLKDSDKVIGFCGFKEIDKDIYEDAGLCIALEYQGIGYAKEVVKKLLDIVFNNLNGKRFIYSCFRENEKSRNVCLGLGFKYLKSENKIREYDQYNYISDSYYLDNKKSNY